MRGKDKCKILRRIRQEIAEKNDIEFVTSECKYQGECRGTCPKCEAELRYLETEMEKRRGLNRKIMLAGVSVGTMIALTGCASIADIRNAIGVSDEKPEIDVLEGEVPNEWQWEQGYVAPMESEALEEEETSPDEETLDACTGEE